MPQMNALRALQSQTLKMQLRLPRGGPALPADADAHL